MIVVDASVAVDVLLQTPDSAFLMERVLGEDESVHVPHLFDVEVAQVIRRYSLRGEISAARGSLAIDDLAALPWTRHDHEALLPRIWTLRNNATAYDAAYLALAEALRCRLVTRDRALSRIRGVKADLEVV